MTRKQLLGLAKNYGLDINEGEHFTTIERGEVVIVIWASGDVTRGDVNPDLATKMTKTQAAKALRLVS